MFDVKEIEAIRAFYDTRDRWHDIQKYRTLRSRVGRVENLFYGDSITELWPLHEFFPNRSLLNRGIGGDNICGLHDRLADDVLPYSPKRVFVMIGINGIEDEQSRIVSRIQAMAGRMSEKAIAVFLCSILPLRSPDNWDRFQYQDKIVAINAELQQWSRSHAAGFLDYHSVVKDATGQLAAECALPDGTHVTFEAYRRMADVVEPHLA